MRIFGNEFFEIVEENGKVFINTFKKGFSIRQMDDIFRKFPRIKVTNFLNLKIALQEAAGQPEEIGYWLPPMKIEVSKDRMTAQLFVYEPNVLEDEKAFREALEDLLEQEKIIFGIKEIDVHSIMIAKPVVVAEGTKPVKGEDAKITYLKIPERKPVIREDGKADYFDMNFIFEINQNDWLGEKIPPKPGINGKNVFGEEIPAPPGKDKPLKYDRKSAYESVEDGKIVLRALTKGVVEERHGFLTVSRHLPINGDVGVETGNIDFDGSITIRGTVQKGFSVIATGDISIEGLEGVTGAKTIESREGDIYIKGGVFGLGQTDIKAGGSIYVKHVNEANLFAKKNIVVGFYSFNSFLQADSILLDEENGKIIGGKAIAKNTIVTAVSGNRMERRTDLIIRSLDRQEGYQIIQRKAALLKSLQEEILRLNNNIEKLSSFKENLRQAQLKTLKQMQEMLENKKQQMLQLDFEIQELMRDIKSAGQGEIIVKKEAYPGTLIQIGNKGSLLSSLTKGRFSRELGELNA
ncbi:FapA family protein [Ureibacillus sp. FSL K6-8385]|uniref:DUF342 domain-containing protein n=1 Tax=Ureibacillus terrenus TaxID=118246 RepID=A0A540V657_9BACL|nr:FapA family protein [Ureibacillus terrenus]MED3660780.1 FapA family protein [Ureibacillus terrenus]MED3762968.1 FapA family protein [Ureibacillus terrenus]TQE92232.1 DUF342 domain-containing protein [Ureibacillus terrenus]